MVYKQNGGRRANMNSMPLCNIAIINVDVYPVTRASQTVLVKLTEEEPRIVVYVFTHDIRS